MCPMSRRTLNGAAEPVMEGFIVAQPVMLNAIPIKIMLKSFMV